MAKAVKNASITYNQMATYLDSLGCPLVSKVDSTHISIDGHVTILFTYQHDYITFNGGSSGTCGRVNDSREVTALWNDNLFYYQQCDMGNVNYVHRSVLVYSKLDNAAWCGYDYNSWSGESHDFYSLTNIPLYNMDNTSITGSYKSAVNYGVTPGYIDYTPYGLIVTGINLQNVDSNFVSCSTVTPNQVVTFNNNNYYTVGTNSLILLDKG